MAGELQTGIAFVDQMQITSARLNAIIGTASFTSNSVAGTTLTVVGGKLKVGTISASELGVSCVASGNIQPVAVLTTHLADGCVDTRAIGNFSVSQDKLAEGAVTFNKMAASSIASPQETASGGGNKFVTASNLKYSDGVAKASGVIVFTSLSDRILSNAHNVNSVFRINKNVVRVNFIGLLLGSNYAVICGCHVPGVSVGLVGCVVKTNTYFEIYHPDELINTTIDFAVFGAI